MQEPVAESFDGMLDARAFDHINADTDHAHLTGPVGRFCEHHGSASDADALKIGLHLIRDNLPWPQAFP